MTAQSKAHTYPGYWRVVIWYRTKRSGVSLGLTVKAVDEDEAQRLAEDHHIRPFPARKLVRCDVSSADDFAMKMGVVNEPFEARAALLKSQSNDESGTK